MANQNKRNDDYNIAETAKFRRSGSLAVVDNSNQSAAETARLNRYRPTTVAGTAGTPRAAPKTAKQKLPRRSFNPLSKFASYTYNLTLYMITPEAFNLFVQTGKRTLRDASGQNYDGVYIVAQSGGINNNVSSRPPGMTMDYFIDNLKTKTYTTGRASGGESNTTTYSFTISEPNSFSFITRLSNAARELLKNSKLIGVNDGININGMRQFFVLGIGFTGWNTDGSIANASEVFASDTFTTGSGTVYERYFDITITKLSFNLDGNMINYNIEASQVSTTEALGTKRGKLFERGVALGSTVQEALLGPGGIIPYINEQQQTMYEKKLIKVPYVYDVRFVNDSDSERIKTAKLITKDELRTLFTNKLSQIPMSNANKIIEVNDLQSVNSNATDNTVKELKFEPNTMMSDVIRKIIQSSTYLTDALEATMNSQLEPVSPNNNEESETNEQDPKVAIQWYSLGSEVEVLGWDFKRNDWSYKITYVIAPYKTPLTSSVYAGKVDTYYGPHKRYDYWFTGENTEIIKYSQALNTAWYEAEAGFADSTPAPQGSAKSVGERVPGNRQGSQGEGLAPQNSYLNSLFSPADWAKAKIEILGDPDFLMYDTPGNLNEIYNIFYANEDDATINPNGGQVFVEIDFKEAIDYNHSATGTLENNGGYHDNGLMTINPSIVFWDYPQIVKDLGVKGISYQLLAVDSIFSKGRFTQELELVINTFDNINQSPQNPGAQATQREVDTGFGGGLQPDVPGQDGGITTLAQPTVRTPENASDGQATNAASNGRASPSSSNGGRRNPPKTTSTTPTRNGVVDDDGSNARDQLLKRVAQQREYEERQRVQNTPVNTRLRQALGLDPGSESLINRFRRSVGLPTSQ